MTKVLVNGEAKDQFSVLDRGFAYGDGLFESIRFIAGGAPLWSRHMQRLRDGCRRLGLPSPPQETLLREARDVVAGMAQAVVRVSLTRGIGERGYAAPDAVQPTRVVAAFAPVRMQAEAYLDGIQLWLCDLRLGEQPALAGIKHLNRLEQVLARAEWSDPAIAEGLLRDQHGYVICATMSNVFAVVDGDLLTPAIDRCGVAGVARAEVLASMPQARTCELTLEALLGASEVFLTSSVRGILPVRALASRFYSPGPVTRQLQQHWCQLGFVMEQGG